MFAVGFLQGEGYLGLSFHPIRYQTMFLGGCVVLQAVRSVAYNRKYFRGRILGLESIYLK